MVFTIQKRYLCPTTSISTPRVLAEFSSERHTNSVVTDSKTEYTNSRNSSRRLKNKGNAIRAMGARTQQNKPGDRNKKKKKKSTRKKTQ